MLMTNEADKKQPYVGNRKHLEFLLIQKWSKFQDSYFGIHSLLNKCVL